MRTIFYIYKRKWIYNECETNKFENYTHSITFHIANPPTFSMQTHKITKLKTGDKFLSKFAKTFFFRNFFYIIGENLEERSAMTPQKLESL